MNAQAGAATDGAEAAGLIGRWQRRFTRWLNRRIPPARRVTLNQRRVFIFPSRVGFFFIACLLVMLVTSINYENNIGFGVTFLLATLFVVGVLHTYANLAGLTIEALDAKPVFAGQETEFRIRLRCDNRRGHIALLLCWTDDARRPRGPELEASVPADSEITLALPALAETRGWFRPGRLRIQTTYPLGLLRSWTWVDLDLAALVYPRPLATPELPGADAVDRSGELSRRAGDDEFFGLRDYRQGDRLQQVYWKGVARGQEPQSKQYSAYVSQSCWLDWQQFPGVGRERRLSQLCYWALALIREQRPVGLRLPGAEIEPGTGPGQREAILRALALFEAPSAV